MSKLPLPRECNSVTAGSAALPYADLGLFLRVHLLVETRWMLCGIRDTAGSVATFNRWVLALLLAFILLPGSAGLAFLVVIMVSYWGSLPRDACLAGRSFFRSAVFFSDFFFTGRRGGLCSGAIMKLFGWCICIATSWLARWSAVERAIGLFIFWLLLLLPRVRIRKFFAGLPPCL